MTRGEKGTLTLYDEASAFDAVTIYKFRGCKVDVKTVKKGVWRIHVDCPHPIPPQLRAALRRVRVMKNGKT